MQEIYMKTEICRVVEINRSEKQRQRKCSKASAHYFSHIKLTVNVNRNVRAAA